MSAPLLVDWSAVAAGLVGHRSRRYFPDGTHHFPHGTLRLQGAEVGLLLEGVRLTVPPVPERPLYSGGQVFIERGRRPPPYVSFDRMVAPAVVADMFDRMYLHRTAERPGPDLRLNLLGENLVVMMELTLECPMLYQVGFRARAEGMEVSEGLHLYVTEMYAH